MPPRAHVPHHDDPSQPLVEEFAHRVKVNNRLDAIRQQCNFVALLGNETAHEKIVRGTVLDRSVAAELAEASSSGRDCRAEREFHSIELPRYKDAGVEIGKHSDRLEPVSKCLFLYRHVKA